MSTNYDIINIQSIIVYNALLNSYAADRAQSINGCALQLLDENDNIVYQSPIINVDNSNQTYRYFRYDGGDIAYASIYLASDEASFITGTTLHINGGMSMI